MATLETQYKNWLKENEPITYSEWLEKFSEIHHLDKLKESTMENKQTAVEWLVQELINSGLLYPISEMSKKIEQALALEKQQIMEAVYDSMGTNFDPNMGRAEMYYNEKYGNKK